MIDVIVTGDVLKAVTKAMVALVSEARFHFNSDGLHSRAVDPANVAMVIVDVPKDSFEVYKVDEEKTIGVDVNRVFDISKAIKSGELVEMKVEDETSLMIKFGSVQYSVALIDPSAIRKEPKVPSLELPAKIVLDAGEFKKAINAADKISDHVVFRSDETGFYIEAEGDVDRIEFHMSEAELIEFNRGVARSMFSIEYLKEFVKTAGSGDVLTIYLGNNYPVRLVFEVADGKAKVEYILAPRIEAE
ncbi:DNA polymerase sliding clamp [Archaeoglobus veneficus]|uniref:DNA polymerase sliding clamp n=1 Tax=Archaeoglobus veneficus (strain DSM 11195 / SNP6) TaxID=693661 RepID=F2KNR4_ARCVS|nr:DNA polymerase sliding clamp [Archaeoglobus veneficus]AEA47391.1 DNA polymerase sliding clamp [Archaeoglobus veneficus SNP6]